MNVQEKIALLRNHMHQHGLTAYIVPGTDPHASEYMAEHWMETTWLSGFKGEAGTVVVTMEEAKLFTDSRYYLQADKELQGTGIELMRASDIDCPTVVEWLMYHAKGDIRTVGVNPEMWSVDEYASMKEELGGENIALKSIDLIQSMWTEDRPAIPQTPFYAYDETYAGESVESKLKRIREKIRQKKADAMVISALDEIAWLLNIRGYDVAYNPVVISYVVLEQDKVTLFVAPEKVDAPTRTYLEAHHINIRAYASVFEYLHSLKGVVLYDGKKVNEALYEAIVGKTVNGQSPILQDKSHKNDVELEGERKAMRQDGVALTRFLRWIYSDSTREAMRAGNVSEWDLMEKLHEFRTQGEHFVEESFCTIAGYRSNGAIVHYEATPETAATVYPEGMLLLDSGGQYLDGTTDITRTIWLGGEIPEQAKRDYTYVLKGHLALGRAIWPRGTRGNQLDALAKQYMWQAGITFGHGTGHGVGHFLGCHEGPQNVRTDMNPTVLEPGQICSNEPGIYRTGEWGIRIENLVTVVEQARTEACTTEDEFLRWETLTLCPYDTNLMDRTLLTEEEIAQINAYHQMVYNALAPLMQEEDAKYLAMLCKAI